ncbi:NAD-dependent epimerase/dehydratase family protein [Pseudomonas japonica]|uniref:NAD-dependent epimerase/dehydratase family protein n=1 Tax=Pseudomonas japonica TaxID=256466 RepID=UPI0038085744
MLFDDQETWLPPHALLAASSGENMRVLVTGAKGFVGRAVFERLQADASITVTGAVRSLPAEEPSAGSYFAIGDMGPDTDWSIALDGVDVVIHLAARAHILNDTNSDPLSAFRRTNVEAALALARSAIEKGVKRFVFISSIGVNGNVTDAVPFSESSVPAPHADYATSKYEAEEALKQLMSGSSMELVIIRPPLVYAAHAPGNFRRLLKLVASGLPMPFGMVKNQRSLVALENLADFIITCAGHPAAANELFLISDDEDVSTAQMLRLLAEGMGKKQVLLPVPSAVLGGLAAAAGKKNLYIQLCGSLQVDSSKCKRLLQWTPPVSVRQGLLEAGREYRLEH